MKSCCLCFTTDGIFWCNLYPRGGLTPFHLRLLPGVPCGDNQLPSCVSYDSMNLNLSQFSVPGCIAPMVSQLEFNIISGLSSRMSIAPMVSQLEFCLSSCRWGLRSDEEVRQHNDREQGGEEELENKKRTSQREKKFPSTFLFPRELWSAWLTVFLGWKLLMASPANWL